jgi:hypothetical protein
MAAGTSFNLPHTRALAQRLPRSSSFGPMQVTHRTQFRLASGLRQAYLRRVGVQSPPVHETLVELQQSLVCVHALPAPWQAIVPVSTHIP